MTVPFVLEQLKCLKPNKAISLDRILSSRLLKDGAEVVAPVLMYIINFSLSSGRFRENWKLAKITALYRKSGKMDNCDNYTDQFLSSRQLVYLLNMLFIVSYMNT